MGMPAQVIEYLFLQNCTIVIFLFMFFVHSFQYIEYIHQIPDANQISEMGRFAAHHCIVRLRAASRPFIL